MPNIFEIFNKCADSVRYLPVHENLKKVNTYKDHGTIEMAVDPKTAYAMQRFSLTGELDEAAFLVVVSAKDFNKYFAEMKAQEEGK